MTDAATSRSILPNPGLPPSRVERIGATPTRWATPPPGEMPKGSSAKEFIPETFSRVALTPQEQAIREQLEERRRNGDRDSPLVERIRAEQRAHADEIARRFGLSNDELAAFVAPHRAALEPYQARLVEAQRNLDRATDGQTRAAALLADKAAALKRFSDAEQAAAERFAAECEASLLSGEPANPYRDWNVEDAVAQRRAEVEHRGAEQAVERFASIIAKARQAIDAARHNLRQAVDEILAEQYGKPLLEQFQAALNEAERLRVEIAGFRGIDNLGLLGMRGLNRSLEQPVIGSNLPSSEEGGVPGDTPSCQGALYAWRQRRDALVNPPADAERDPLRTDQTAA